MKRLLAPLFVAALFTGGSALAVEDLQALTGKWSVKKTNDEGQVFTQTVEVNKDKFIFEILGADAALVRETIDEQELISLPHLKRAKGIIAARIKNLCSAGWCVVA